MSPDANGVRLGKTVILPLIYADLPAPAIAGKPQSSKQQYGLPARKISLWQA